MSTAEAYFAQATPDGISVRSHLAELIHRLLLSKEADALEKLETISMEVKAGHFNASAPGVKDLPAVSQGDVDFHGTPVPTEAWLKRAKGLFKGAGAEEVPKLMDELPMFEHVGVGVTRDEAYRLYLAMGAAKAKHGLHKIRFFGKILGTGKDYYVLECVAPTETHVAPAATEGAPAELPGCGLNSCCYLVAPSAADEFVMLPDVTPEEVLASAAIRKFFTGELDAAVACYPPFPGTEAAYLRAQIARIAAATTLVPTGKLAFDEESEAEPKPIVDAEEYAVPDDLTSLDSWVHLYGGVLKIGRCTNPPKPEPAEGEEDADEPEQEEEAPALGAASADGPVSTLMEEEELAAWSVKAYNTALAGGAYSVAVATSNRWPGAYVAGATKADKYSNLYFGWGHEATGKTFTPAAPPPIMSESAEADEGDEVSLEAENALLREIDEAKIAAASEGAEAEVE